MKKYLEKTTVKIALFFVINLTIAFLLRLFCNHLSFSMRCVIASDICFLSIQLLFAPKADKNPDKQ